VSLASTLALALVAFPLRAAPADEPRRWVENLPPNSTAGITREAAVSPVFRTQNAQGATTLRVRSFESPVARELAGTEGATLPFRSPESRTIEFCEWLRLDAGGEPVGAEIGRERRQRMRRILVIDVAGSPDAQHQEARRLAPPRAARQELQRGPVIASPISFLVGGRQHVAIASGNAVYVFATREPSRWTPRPMALRRRPPRRLLLVRLLQQPRDTDHVKRVRSVTAARAGGAPNTRTLRVGVPWGPSAGPRSQGGGHVFPRDVVGSPPGEGAPVAAPTDS
jgi:hypothetical protein